MSFKPGDLVRLKIDIPNQSDSGVIVPGECKEGEVAWVPDTEFRRSALEHTERRKSCIALSELKIDEHPYRCDCTKFKENCPFGHFVNGDRVRDVQTGQIGTIVLDKEGWRTEVNWMPDNGDGTVHRIEKSRLEKLNNEGEEDRDRVE